MIQKAPLLEPKQPTLPPPLYHTKMSPLRAQIFVRDGKRGAASGMDLGARFGGRASLDLPRDAPHASVASERRRLC